MQNFFNEVLSKDEKLIKVVKPNKKRYNKDMYLVWFITPAIIVALIGLVLIFPAVLYVMSCEKAYKNTCYAYTDKRIIIRSGVLHVRYDSLDYKDATYAFVKTGFFDKSLNTGVISFNSPSVPKNDPEEPYLPISFKYVENPHEVLKDIKNYMFKE